MPLRYLFVDMNSYFASVEQQERPELRGRPMAVVPVMAETTCCIAASYEAKRHGVKTGTRVSEARRMSPGIRIVEARPPLYIEYHHRIVEAVDSCLPVLKVSSIDEMVCELPHSAREPAGAEKLAREVKTALRREVGEYVRASIGVAPNRLVAKIASDMQKPDGLTIVCSEELPSRLFALELTDLPGIGKRMEKRFHAAQITTVRELCESSESQLNQAWGSRLLGGSWFRRLRGEDLPEPPTQRSSVGHSHVLAPELRNPQDARDVLLRLVHKAAARLRHIGYLAGSVNVSVDYLREGGWQGGRKIALCQDTITLVEVAAELWEERPAGPLLKVGVVFGNLLPEASATPFLLEEPRKRQKLSSVMDQVNRKLSGPHGVYLGTIHGRQEHMPTRIAFTQIPDSTLYDW